MVERQIEITLQYVANVAASGRCKQEVYYPDVSSIPEVIAALKAKGFEVTELKDNVLLIEW